MLIENRVAVITGGASGIGRASSVRFLNEGAKVVVADVNPASGDAFLKLAEELGFADRVRFVTTDVTDEADVERMIGTATDVFGTLDIMFNNAGIPGALGPLEEVAAEDWDRTFDVLVKGPFLGLKHAVRQFKAQGSGGVILNTSSAAGLVGGAGPRPYSVAKAAVAHLTTVAAVDLAAHRIRVNAIAPGAILTEIGGQDPVEAAARLSKGQPWPDHGMPTDIAAAAVFLASDEARFITGQTILVDGGATSDSGMEVRLQRGGAWAKVTGMHHGTTGKKSELRRLERKD
ncbi:SDR family NAD(P)-dependent oxidoreductase [Novosphingobium pokkalii]|uniref:SDR family NAD(P)-dependent oxidoreductase n=1 Tax=Novosphingobium pokkalii TaxID=1770194 RepID=A0ABV7V9F7_9SPHN|nr:SDR family oxidoreductase [Novosphingobium pokkalii]GHD01212.1 2,5-dichloro-2,5-cyclohexadiene-1,4-diol dehydrogenase [Novosphingobium pokkalii]